jgi:hypothetical protein
MIRKLKSGSYRLYSRKKDAKSGQRKNLGTFKTRSAAEKHERAVQYFKHPAKISRYYARRKKGQACRRGCAYRRVPD